MIAFRGVGAHGFHATGGNITPDLPAGLTAGDLMVLSVGHMTDDNVDFGGLTGWTWFARDAVPARWATACYWKIATGADVAPTVTCSGSANFQAVIAAWSGVDQTDPIQPVVKSWSTGTIGVTTFTGRPVPALCDNSVAISICQVGDDSALSMSVDQGFTLRAGGVDYDIPNISFGLADKTIATATASVTFPTWLTPDTESIGTTHFVLRPDGSGDDLTFTPHFGDVNHLHAVNGTSIFMRVPSVKEGDLMVGVIGNRAADTATYILPGSFVELDEGAYPARFVCNISWQIAGATTPRVYEWQLAGGAQDLFGWMFTIPAYAFDPSDPIGAVAAQVSGSAATMTPNTAATVADNELLVALCCTADDNTVDVTTAAGFTQQAGSTQHNSTLGVDMSFGMASKLQPTAGTTTMPTFTQTTNSPDPYIAFAFAVNRHPTATTYYTGGAPATDPFEDDFVGDNNDPWDTTKWDQTAGSGGGDTIILGNKGQAKGSAGNALSGGQAKGKQGKLPNQKITGLFQLCETGEPCGGALWLQTSDDWAGLDHPTEGYGVRLPSDSDVASLIRAVNGIITVLDVAVWPRDTGSKRFEFRRQNKKIRFKIWDDGETAPKAWTLSATDTTITPDGSGAFQVAYTCPLAPTVDACAFFDDIVVVEDDTPPVDPPNITGGGIRRKGGVRG